MNCATATLAPYVPSVERPWNRIRITHLHRRAGLGAPIETLLSDLADEPEDVVEGMINAALALPPDPEPDYAFYDQEEFGGALALLNSTLSKDGRSREWIISLQTSGLRGRMDLFWHNHFVTKFDVYESAAYSYQYQNLIQVHGLGNFRDFVRAIGLTPAMLVFLNGAQNVGSAPNENYARELYELFTLGDENGYTQTDIEETARALTGYTNILTPWGVIEFDPATHDNGQKTIFGQTGNWGYDDVIDILFEQRGELIAGFIAGKLYEHFVNPERDEDFISELAQVFLNNDFEIAPTLQAMFASAHFFDPANFATVIPGHLEHQLIFMNEINVLLNGLSVFGIWSGSAEQGQNLFNPVDVAGWPGNRSWINTTSIRYRWDTEEAQIGAAALFGYAYFQEMAQGLTDEFEDVEIICQDLIEFFLPNGLQFQTDFDDALAAFKGSVPANYFTDGVWNLDFFAVPFQLGDLLSYLVRIPEFQLR